MRSGDLTSAAAIRETAMALFAERGVAAVSVRDIATAAGVSPSLVIHHYKSKEGLHAAVEERVAGTFLDLLEEFAAASESGESTGSIAATVAAHIDADPALIGYLRRLFLDGGPSAGTLFRRLFDLAVKATDDMERAGIVRPSRDAAARAAFLLVNDLAVILLRQYVAEVIGDDPLGTEGLARWTAVGLDIYGNGVFTESAFPEEP